MKLTYVVLAGITLALANLSQAQDWANKRALWAKPFISSQKSRSLGASFLFGGLHYSKGFPTKYELAVVTILLVERFSMLLENPSVEQKLYRESLACDVGWELAQLERLTRFTSKELKELGIEPETIRESINRTLTIWQKEFPELARPFPDVSAQHWATGSIANLRKAGILVGYSDGRFCPPSH